MMKTFTSLLLVVGLSVAGIRAVDAKEKEKPAAAPADKGAAAMKATLSSDEKGKTPTMSFTSANANVFLSWTDAELKKGDTVKAVWYIEDGGPTVVKNAKLTENTQTAQGGNSHGTFNIAKPAAGWPKGKWRVELYVNNAKVAAYKFTVS